MKCHYEVLSIPRDAEDAEIKSAYRKMALKWHPDKNLDNMEEAKQQFQLVQQAYEVLSDKMERAWYDNHRDQILRAKSETPVDSINLFQYFTTTCFKGYGDDKNGFYSVYREVFSKLMQEEVEFLEDKEELDAMPGFGYSTSDYDEVVRPFYEYWHCFCTKRTFTWHDPYDIHDVRERRVLKLIEKENNKVRMKYKKERNEEIRNLVAFIRKRDKRVQAHAAKEAAKIVENRKKHQELSKQKRLQNIEEIKSSGHQAEWTKFDNVKSKLEEIEKDLAQEFGESPSNSEEECEEDFSNLYCVACNKIFKTPKAFENHESSKKHKENVEALKQSMMEEEEALCSENSTKSLEEENLDADLLDEVEEKNGFAQLEDDVENDLEDAACLSESDSERKKEKKQKKKNKKPKNIMRTKHLSETDHGSDSGNSLIRGNGVLKDDDDSDADFSLNSSKKQKKKNKKSNTKTKQPGNNKNAKNSDSITVDAVDRVEEEVANGEGRVGSEEDEKKQEAKVSVNLEGKNRGKGNKKNKKQNGRDAKVDAEDLDVDHCCVSCKAKFPSKNKLFEHLKTTGHSVLLTQNDKPTGKSKKKLREK